MAQDEGHAVRHLVLISKPGAAKRLAAPSSRAIVAWAARAHDLTITVHEPIPWRPASDHARGSSG